MLVYFDAYLSPQEAMNCHYILFSDKSLFCVNKIEATKIQGSHV
jgi:hypothetical protein